MAKITISRLFDTSGIASTQAFQQLREFIFYVLDLAEQVLRNLRNGLTFSENFNCTVSTVSLVHGIAQVINTGGKRPIGILVIHTNSATTPMAYFSWFVDSQGRATVLAGFRPNPPSTTPPTTAVPVSLVILY
jgi:hypothetical protein